MKRYEITYTLLAEVTVPDSCSKSDVEKIGYDMITGCFQDGHPPTPIGSPLVMLKESLPGDREEDLAVFQHRQSYRKSLEEKHSDLKRAFTDIHWMAQRYADGRRSYAVSMFNQAVKSALAAGATIDKGPLFAKDAMGNVFAGLTAEDVRLEEELAAKEKERNT